jgi:hypothetical protein
MQLTKWVGAVIALVLLGVCCTGTVRSLLDYFGPGPKLQINAAPANPPKVSIPRAEVTGVVAPDGWPRACALITDDDVRAVLPQAQSVGHQGWLQTFKSLDLGPGGGGVTTFAVAEAHCKITFRLPGTHKKGGGQLDLDLEFVGSPHWAEANFHATGPSVQLGDADVCVQAARGTYVCRKQGVDFRLVGGVSDVNLPHDKGRTVWDAFGDTGLTEFVKLVVAKLP